MSGKYAADTSVSVERSRAEIEAILERYGADQFAYGKTATEAVIAFRMEGRQVQFRVPIPDRTAREFTHGPSGRPRVASVAYTEWEKAQRQRWRALALVVKAKLEAVDVGISTFEGEFLGNILLPGGETVAEWMAPQLVTTYELGKMPALLALPSGPTP